MGDRIVRETSVPGTCADLGVAKSNRDLEYDALQTSSLHPRSPGGQVAAFPDMRISLLIWSADKLWTTPNPRQTCAIMCRTRHGCAEHGIDVQQLRSHTPHPHLYTHSVDWKDCAGSAHMSIPLDSRRTRRTQQLKTVWGNQLISRRMFPRHSVQVIHQNPHSSARRTPLRSQL